MKNTDKFPEVNYDLCPRMHLSKMIGGICFHQGVFGSHGECMAPGMSIGTECPPIKKYLKELRSGNAEKH